MKLYKPLSLLSILLVATLLVACGSDFGEAEHGQLSLETGTEAEFALEVPPTDDRHQAQAPITFRNTGNGPLEVTNLELVNVPDRVQVRQSSTGESCEYADGSGANFDVQGTCDEGMYCSRTANSECWPLELSETPFTLERERTHSIELVVFPGDNRGLECDRSNPPAGAPSDYCGHLTIETNATNDEGPIENGEVTIYFTAMMSSGEIEVDPSSFSFVGVDGGESVDGELTISNPHPDETLHIHDVLFTSNGEHFELDDNTQQFEIEPGGSVERTITFTAPEDWGNQEEGSETMITNLRIDSSARNESETNVSISVKNSYELPAINLEPNILRFHEDSTQTLTVSNDGTASLVLRSVSSEPSSVLNHYSFEIEGESFDRNLPSSKVLRAPESERCEDEPEEERDKCSVDIDVIYDGEADDGGIGTLQFKYTYEFNGENVQAEADAMVLGDAGDAPIGMVAPDRLHFSTNASGIQQRSFVMRNIGTQPLDITNYGFEPVGCNPNTDADCDTDDEVWLTEAPPSTIEPGGLEEIKLEFDPQESDHEYIDLNFLSNSANATDGRSDQMRVSLTASDDPATDLEAAISAGFEDDTTEVNTEAPFSARQSANATEELLEDAVWTLLERPDASDNFVHTRGADISFVPDEVGIYKLGLILYEGRASTAETYTFEVVAPSDD